MITPITSHQQTHDPTCIPNEPLLFPSCETHKRHCPSDARFSFALTLRAQATDYTIFLAALISPPSVSFFPVAFIFEQVFLNLFFFKGSPSNSPPFPVTTIALSLLFFKDELSESAIYTWLFDFIVTFPTPLHIYLSVFFFPTCHWPTLTKVTNDRLLNLTDTF